MGMFSVLDIAGSAMAAQSQRLSAIASNLANVDSSTSADGRPYRARQVVFEVQQIAPGATGVKVARVVESAAPLRKVYQPGHPQADASGMVSYPNVDPVEEMVNMISASRAYQMNAELFNTSRSLLQRTLEIGR